MSAEPVSSAPATNDASLWDDDAASTSESVEESQPAATPELDASAPTDSRTRDAQGRFTKTGEAQPEAQPSAPAPTAPAEQPKTFSILDRPVTQDELLRMAENGELDRHARTASQFSYLQQLHLAQKQEIEALRAAQQQQRQQAQPQGSQGIQVTPQAIQAYFAPKVKELVAQGAIEPEAAELFPMAISRMMFMDELRVQTEQRAAMAEQRVSQMENYLNGLYQGNQAQDAANTVSRYMQAVAARGDFYGELADQKVQGEFLDYLVNKINPPMDMVDENLIAQQFAAYRSNQLVEAAKAMRAAQAATQAQAVRQAVGEGAGPRPGVPVKNDVQADLEEMFSSDY